MIVNRVRCGISLGLLLSVAGCGGSKAETSSLPPTVPVSGVVTKDGKPLQHATVKFVPQGTTKGVECYGRTDDAGRFELQQMRGGAGAPPGDYLVAVSHFAKPDGSPVPMGPGDPPPADAGAIESLPPRYSNPTDSKLVAKVSDTGGEFKFDLKSR